MTKGETTRDMILSASALIFGQKGYHAASMQDIADAVNLQKASLYHHFQSKQEILLALLDLALDLLIERMAGVIQETLPPQEKLHHAMLAYVEIVTEHQDLAHVLLLEHTSLEPGMHNRHVPRRNRYEALWRALIQEGIDTGVFCCVEAGFTARALLGVMSWTITWYRPEGPLKAGEIAERYTQLFMHGLLSRDGGGA